MSAVLHGHVCLRHAFRGQRTTLWSQVSHLRLYHSVASSITPWAIFLDLLINSSDKIFPLLIKVIYHGLLLLVKRFAISDKIDIKEKISILEKQEINGIFVRFPYPHIEYFADIYRMSVENKDIPWYLLDSHFNIITVTKCCSR